MISKRIVVKGKVQGVGFRSFVYRRASELGIVGFVRNLPNGSVEVEAEGEDIDVDTLVDYCRIGPTRARVDSIVAMTQSNVGYTEFRVG